MSDIFLLETIPGENRFLAPRGGRLTITRANRIPNTFDERLREIARSLQGYLKDIVSDFLPASEIGGVVGHLQLFLPLVQRAHVSTKAISLDSLDPEAIENILEKLVQSNEDVELQDLYYDFYFSILC